MEDRIERFFSGTEIKLRKELFSLMQDWEKTVSNELFCRDGFFPGYYGTNPKVLFIGREPRYTRDYIESTIATFRNENINQKSLIFFQRILGIYNVIRNKGIIDESITEDQIAKSMVDKNNYGFAAINISKYSNDSETGASCNKVLMNKFFENSKLDQRNFIKEELEILDPDLIITANLWGCGIKRAYLDDFFGKPTYLNKNVVVKSNWAAALNSIEIKKRVINLIDLYHFSRWNVSGMDYYYKPVSELLFGNS